MFEITSITSARLVQAGAVKATPGQPGRGPSARDRVELSEAARHPPRLSAREAARVHELRARIAAGKYVTADKLDYVADRLHAELRGPRAYVA